MDHTLFIRHLLLDTWVVSTFSCCEPRSTNISSRPCFQFFGVFAQEWDHRIMWCFYVSEKPPDSFPQQLHRLTSHRPCTRFQRVLALSASCPLGQQLRGANTLPSCYSNQEAVCTAVRLRSVRAQHRWAAPRLGVLLGRAHHTASSSVDRSLRVRAGRRPRRKEASTEAPASDLGAACEGPAGEGSSR